MSAVGPMTTAWRRKEGEKLDGRRRRNVIIDVGRSSTERDAKIKEMDTLLRLAWKMG